LNLRNLNQQYSSGSSSSRVDDMSDLDIEAKAIQAREWLVHVLASHTKLLRREHEIRIFRFAIEKELTGAKEEWSDIERLYMTLTNLDIPDAIQRLRMAFLMVIQFNFVERLGDIDKLATQQCEAIERASTLDSEANHARSDIVERAQNIKVDHFACATPLASLKLRPDIVDDNEGCCPICQNSYTNLSTNTLQELLDDFPVRIKYCGHIIGKACLERWMCTPKINVARYPDRTCPMCRVKIEGVATPPIPTSLRMHVKNNRMAAETLKDLMYNYDMEVDECLDTIGACMNEEIACRELLDVINKEKRNNKRSFEREEKMLEEKMERLKKEKWTWGFRGEQVWRQLSAEWMNSGVVRMR
jgi:hypothetical protein